MAYLNVIFSGACSATWCRFKLELICPTIGAWREQKIGPSPFGVQQYAITFTKASISLNSVICIAGADVPEARPVKAEAIAVRTGSSVHMWSLYVVSASIADQQSVALHLASIVEVEGSGLGQCKETPQL